MAEIKKSTGGGWGDFGWFFMILFILIFMWFSTNRDEKTITRPPAQKSFFSDIKFIPEYPQNTTTQKKEISYQYPPIKKPIFISDIISARENNVNKEYIVLEASPENNNPVLFTGWSVGSSALGRKINIGRGSDFPYQGAINLQRDIYLNPRDIVYISSGRSPIGTSFRVNKCSGYLEQFQDFYPPLYKKCPNPYNDFIKNNSGRLYDEKCSNYMQRITMCEIPLRITTNIDSQCAEYAKTKINYNTCVENHKNDPDFYKNEWRIFLGENNEIWKNNRDVIKIFDQEEKVIDSSVY